MAGYSPHNYMNPNAEIRKYNGEYYMYTPTKTQDMGWGAIGTGGTVENLGALNGYDLKQKYGLYPGDIFNATIDPITWANSGKYTPDEIKSNIQQTFSGFDKDNKTGWQAKLEDLTKQASDLYNADPTQRDKVFGTVWNNFRNANLPAIQDLQAQNNQPRPEFSSQSEAMDYAAQQAGGNAGAGGAGAPPIVPSPLTPPTIPFKTGLSDAQKTSITNLMARTTALNETDAKNYGFATGSDYKQYVGKTPQQILGGSSAPSGAAGTGAPAGGNQPTPLTDPSVVNFLTGAGLPSDYASRLKMAQERGITGYNGTSAQNSRLLAMLRQEYSAGTLGKPVDPSALPKATQTEQNQGQATDPQAEIDRINAEANSLQDSELSTITGSTSKVDLSKSAGLTEKLIGLLNDKATQDKAAPSLQQKFLDERTKLGVGALETSLASLDAKLKQLDADYASTIEGEEGKLVSMREVGRRQSAEGIAYNRARRDLVAERDSVANQLNTKYGVIKSIMDVAGMDYDNAQQNYQNQFNQSLQLINLVKGVENDAKDAQEKAVDNARANAQIMVNLLKDGNIKYENLDAGAKADIKNLEIQAGLPTGFLEFITGAVDEPLIHFGTAFTDAKGDRIQPVMTVDKNTGNITTKNVIVGKDKVVSSNNNGNKVDPSTKAWEADLKKARAALASGGSKVWGETWNFLYNQYHNDLVAFAKQQNSTPEAVLDSILNKNMYYPK